MKQVTAKDLADMKEKLAKLIADKDLADEATTTRIDAATAADLANTKYNQAVLDEVATDATVTASFEEFNAFIDSFLV